VGVDCAASTDPINTGTATATGTGVLVTYNDVRTDGNCAGNYSLARTWIATGTCGTATYTQTITVTDKTAPVITISRLAACYLSEAAAQTAIETASSATDDCSGPAVVIVTLTNGGGSCSVTYTVSATDGCSNASTKEVTVHVDGTAPTLANLPTGGDLGCNPTLPICSTVVTASDLCDGDVSASVTCTPGPIKDVDTCGKTQTFTYKATDSCGNPVSEFVTYTWKEDTTPPTLANLPTGGDLGCNPTLPILSLIHI
jgi:hypothetical protein